MDLFIYETPDGNVADFRPYLDGFDHSFEDHRPLRDEDPRQEKIRGLMHPRLGYELAGQLRFLGTSWVKWRELMIFPIEWSGDLLAGADPILELYVHSGFSPVWHYERVLALDIEGGAVVGREDRSTEVAAYRRDREDGLHEDDDDNAFERLLKSIRLRLPFLGDGDIEDDDELDDELGTELNNEEE